MIAAVVNEAYQQLYRDAQAMCGGEPLWLAEARASAWQVFAQRGMPSMREEAWKYTDLRVLGAQNFTLAKPEIVFEDVDLGGVSSLQDSYRMVFVDGIYRAACSSADFPDGVMLLHGSAAWQYVQSLWMQRREQILAQPLLALTQALLSECCVVVVAAGVKVCKPIELIYVAGHQPNVTTHIQTLVVLEAGAQAALVESYGSVGDNMAWTSVHTAIQLGAQARLDSSFNQEVNEKSFVTTRLDVTMQRDSTWDAHDVNLGARLARREIVCQLAGEGAQTQWGGVALLNGRQHADYQLRWEHRVPNTKSDTKFRTVLAERSRGVFNGHIKVFADAQKTDAQLNNKNLLLSADAEIDTKPQLEIDADDVKCAHGATVGQMDEMVFHYMRSRGIDAATARSLLIYAFASELLPMRHEVLRRHAQQAMLAKLPQGDALREVMAL
jgi:Fe-S cluster assembly protein SufD